MLSEELALVAKGRSRPDDTTVEGKVPGLEGRRELAAASSATLASAKLQGRREAVVGTLAG